MYRAQSWDGRQTFGKPQSIRLRSDRAVDNVSDAYCGLVHFPTKPLRHQDRYGDPDRHSQEAQTLEISEASSREDRHPDIKHLEAGSQQSPGFV